MRLTLRHQTVYLFSEPQSRIVQLLRLTPHTFPGQNILSWSIECNRDARFRGLHDGHGNDATMLYVDGPVDSLAITATGEAWTEDRAGVVDGAPEPLPTAYYLQRTPLTGFDRAVEGFAAEIGGGTRLARAHALAEAVGDRIARVDPEERLDPAAAAVLARGSGDAQGAAHLLVAAARAAGYPARYVAGYLYRPDDEAEHGAHGWAELFVDDYGWIAFDPSEGCCPSERHIRVATGLDHAQAAPLSGARTGGGGETLSVAVDLRPYGAAR